MPDYVATDSDPTIASHIDSRPTGSAFKPAERASQRERHFLRGMLESLTMSFRRASLVNTLVSAMFVASVGCTAPEPQGELPPAVEDLGRSQQASVDCTQWTDKGYVDGVPFDITLVTVDGEPVEVATANAYIVMQTAAAAAGVTINVVSGFRTYAEQEYFYNCYINCNCNNCNLAAKPGYSNHQSGHALDLNTSSGGVLSWLNAHGADYGFERTVSSEDWHWEWWGGGPGGGPCDDNTPPTTCTVTTTGKSGECMDTAKCAALGDHESTPGYCPGPANIQCCTSTATSTPDAAVEEEAAAPDAEVEPEAGTEKDAGTGPDAAPAKDAGTVKDAGVTSDASSDSGPGKDGGGFYVESSDSGGCHVAASGSARSASPFAALFAALFVALTTRRIRRS